jgi:hypothetical protein
LTGSQTTSLLDLKQNWNTSGTATALKLNVTDTASNAASLLIDLQVGGSSKFGINKSGYAQVGNTTGNDPYFNGAWLLRATGQNKGVSWSSGGNNGVSIISSSSPSDCISIANSVLYVPTILFSTSPTTGSGDITLSRKAAANLRFGAADAATPVAQTLSVQSIVGGGGTPNLSAAAYPFKITGAQGTGQGAGGSIIFQTAPAAASSGNGQNGLTDALTIDSVGSVQIVRALTVATLPGTPLAGMIARVSDALTPVIGMTVASGGAAYALVNYNGSNWTVIGV